MSIQNAGLEFDIVHLLQFSCSKPIFYSNVIVLALFFWPERPKAGSGVDNLQEIIVEHVCKNFS